MNISNNNNNTAANNNNNNKTLPQQETPKPKQKMRTLQWNKIPLQRVFSGKKNVWTAMGKTKKSSNSECIDFSEMEELFCAQKSGNGNNGAGNGNGVKNGIGKGARGKFGGVFGGGGSGKNGGGKNKKGGEEEEEETTAAGGKKKKENAEVSSCDWW